MKMLEGWKRLLVVLALLTFLPLSEGLAQQSARSAPLVLRGGTLIDGTGRPPLKDAVIVIDGGKFARVGGQGTRIPPDATVVDLQGKYIIPGLVDSHTHYRPWCGELFLNHGVTTIFYFNPRSANGNSEESIRASQQSAVRSPRIFGPGDRFPLRAGMTREQVLAQFRRWMTNGPDFAVVSSYSANTQEAYRWAAEVIHEAELFVFGHTDNAPESIRAGQDGVEHLWGFAQALMTPEELENFQKGEYLHWGLFFRDPPRMDAMIREAVQRGVYLNPTLVYELGSQSALAHQHELDIYEVYRDPALMTYYPESLASSLLLKFRAVRNFSRRYENPVPLSRLGNAEAQQFQEAYRLSGEFVKRWVELGGKIIGGSDDPQIGTAGLSLHLEMAMLVESGLTPMQALQAATLWGAEMLTARKNTPTAPPVGFVGEGANADLVVLTENPLDNISNTQKIERVMKGGQFVKLGYTPYYTSKGGPLGAIPSTPEPEISAITPHTVTEGSTEFEMTIEGEGFVGNSVVRVDGMAVPTTFVSVRTLKARIPAAAVAHAAPNRFRFPGPAQRAGVYGDRTVKITVYNAPPDGGTSNSVSLRILAKWLAGENE